MSTRSAGPGKATPGWRLRFVEQLGSLGVDAGTPRSMVLVLGWLVVCDPPEQTAQELEAALKLSAGSVSTGVRALIDLGMVERRARTGDRRTYYKLRPGAWDRALRARLAMVAGLRRVADAALSEAGDEADDRLRDMRELYAWFEEQTGKLLANRR
ncbi:MAG: GbsR/MarR family transcriptional regulator [Acidimicrobiales bacterium]